MINLALFCAVAMGQNHPCRALFFDTFDEARQILSDVGNQRLRLISLNECYGLYHVVTFAAHQAKSQRQAEHINAQVIRDGEAAVTPA